MKIRNGFVSNSSSSSFVLALPHEPKSIEDLAAILTGFDTDLNKTLSTDIVDNPKKIKDYVKRIFKDIQKAKKKYQKTDIQKFLYNMVEHRHYNHWRYPIPDMFYAVDKDLYYEIKVLEGKQEDYRYDSEPYKELKREIEELTKKLSHVDVDIFYDKFSKDSFLIPLSYADDDGDEIAYVLASGLFFDEIPYMTERDG